MLTEDADGGEPAHWQYDLLFSIGSSSWLIHFSVVVLTAAVLTIDGPATWILVWCLSMGAGTISLAQLSYLYRRRRPDGAGARRYGVVHAILTSLIGLTWGTGALYAAGDAQNLLFYTLVMGGAALGAVSSQHARLPNCMASIWTSVPLLSVAQVSTGFELRNVAAAGMMLLFGASLTVMATRIHGFLIENTRINELLKKQNAELTKVSDELREAQDVRLRFLAQASHDLRQPIHAVGLFVECLKAVRPNRESKELLTRIDRSMSTLARLCRSLLDVAALDVGKVAAQPTEIALSEVIGDVVRQAEEAAQENGVQIRVVDTRLWTRTDAALLHNMLQNLLSNAIKYAPNGKVLIGVRRSGDAQMALEIVDQGAGIPASDQSRVFSEFVRLENSATRRTEGLGLGLSIVRRLAVVLGFTLDLRSRPGAGTRFRIDGLPVTTPTRTPFPQPAYQSQLNGMNVLVIDDDDSVRESTAQILKRWGCQVRASESFPKTEVTESADFIICDQHLKCGHGLDLVRRARQKTSRSVPAVIITGGEVSTVQAGVVGEHITVLSKPVRPAQLRSMLVAARAKESANGQTSPRSTAMPAAAAREETLNALNKAET